MANVTSSEAVEEVIRSGVEVFGKGRELYTQEGRMKGVGGDIHVILGAVCTFRGAHKV